MKEFKSKLEGIVEKFISNNVTEEGKKDFIVAAIHFNINSNDCSKYDLMRIDRKVKILADSTENEILTKASVYSYILFRAIQRNEIPKDIISDIKLTLVNICSVVTDYFTYRIDENELNVKLMDELGNLVCI